MLYVPYSMQVYEFHDAPEAGHLINQLRRLEAEPVGEWVVNLTREDGDIIDATIQNPTFRSRRHFFVTLLPADHCLIVQGASAYRHRIIALLARTFGVNSDNIREYMIGNRWRQLLESITSVNERNRVASITARANDGVSFPFEGEQYKEMTYSLGYNRSALDHEQIGTFLEHAKTCKLELRECADLVNEDDELIMIINNNCNFRLFTDREQVDWNGFYTGFVRGIILG